MRAKIILVIMLLALGASGCAGGSQTVTTSLDQGGQPVKVEAQISDQKAWIDGQVALAGQAKPFLELKVPPGRDLVLPGGTELRLWGQPAGFKLEPHQAPWERVLNRWGGALVASGSAGWMVHEMRLLGEGLGGQSRYVLNNVGNGSGSPFSWESQKGQGSSLGVNMPTTTTTTTTLGGDDHGAGGAGQ